MRTYIFAFSALIMVACAVENEPGTTPSESPTATNTESDEPLYQYWPSQGQAQIIFQTVTQADEAYRVSYPTITNLEPEHPLSQAINQTLRQNMATFTNEATLFFNDSAEGLSAGVAIPWDYSIEWLGGRYDRSLWSLALQVFTYQGGAHGNTFTQTFNYWAPDVRLISFNELFTSTEYQAVWLEWIKKELIKEKTYRWENTNQAETYDPQLDSQIQALTYSEDLTDAWVVAERDDVVGFLFFFAPYEVGSYAEGGYEVFIPLSELESWLNPIYQTAFD